MIRRLVVLAGKDFRIFLADPVAIGLGFVVPLVMILVFGLVFGRSGARGLEEFVVPAVNQDAGPAGGRLLRSLDALAEIRILETLKGDTVKLDSARARQQVARGRSSVAIIVPRDFSEGLKQGELRLTLLEDPRDPISAGVVAGLLQREVFTTFPGLLPASLLKSGVGTDSVFARSLSANIRQTIAQHFGVHIPETVGPLGLFPEEMILGRDPDLTLAADSSRFGIAPAMAGLFKVKREAVVGQNIVNPGIAQSVAGPAVMFVLFAVGAIAATLLREMRDGTAYRLVAGGVRPGELLVAKYAYSVLLASVQLVVMMFYGWAIFRLQIFDRPDALLVMILCTSAVMAAVGLFIAALSRTEEQATGYQVVVILAMAAIGGAMFPSFMIPKVVRSLAQVTPVHWAMQGFLDIFWRQQGLAGIGFECALLLGMAALMVGVAVVLFRRRLALELG